MKTDLEYQTGDPPKVGVYACRVPFEESGLMEDIFLIWMGKKWGYLSSDQNYRGNTAPIWIGPLPRTRA